MKNTDTKLLSLWLAGTLCLATAPVLAATDDDNTDGEIEAALVLIEADPNDSAKFEQYRDVPDGLVLPHVEVNWEASEDVFGGGMWVGFEAFDAIEDDQRLYLGFGSRGLWKGELTWEENPRLFGDNAQSLYTHQGDGVFTLVDSLQAAFAAGGAVGPTSGNPWRGQTVEHGVWDAGTKGAILRDALAQAPEIEVGYQRETGAARFEFTPTKAWRLGFGLQRETRDGTKPSSQSFGFSSVAEIAAPIDYTTDTFDVTAEYSRKHWVLGAKYIWSDFQTEYNSLTWDNINRVDDGASGPGRGGYWLSDDNEMNQWQLYFGANLPGHTRINFTASQINTSQDELLMGQTVNSYLNARQVEEHPNPDRLAPNADQHIPGVPASSSHGDIDNQLIDFRVNSRPLDWLRLKAWYRDYEQENDTPSLEFDGLVNYDTSVGTNPRVPPITPSGTAANVVYDWLMRANLPYGYEKENLGALIGFTPADWVDVALSWDREDMERHHSAVEDSRQDTWKLTADFYVNEHLSLRTSYLTQDREAHEYHIHYLEESFPNGESVEYAFNEGARKFYLTDRERDAWSLMADITVNSKFGIYAEAQGADSEYYDPETGLRIGDSYTVMADQNNDGVDEEREIRLSGRKENDETSYTLGFSITPNENWEIYADYTWENLDWKMASTYRAVTTYDVDPSGNVQNVGFGQDDPLGNWDNEVEDEYETFTMGFNGKWADGKWEVMGDLTIAQATGTMTTDFVEGGNASSDTDLTRFPNLDNDFTIAHLGFERHLANGWDVGFKYWYEKWTDDNWTTDYNAPYVGNPDQDPSQSDWIALGLDFADYENHILMLMARYSF